MGIIPKRLQLNWEKIMDTVWVVDPDMNVHRFVADPVDGKVLSSQKIPAMEFIMRMILMDPNMMLKSGKIFDSQMMGPGMTGGNWEGTSH